MWIIRGVYRQPRVHIGEGDVPMIKDNRSMLGRALHRKKKGSEKGRFDFM